MIKNAFLTILIFCLLLASACRKSETSSDSSTTEVFGGSDQTQEATELVNDANKDLKKIKEIYKENEDAVPVLSQAMNQKDTEKVQKMANDLVYKMNDGMNLGRSAIEKIEAAEQMNINDTFKEYLRLKELALRKQLEAFQFRHEAGILLRDGFGGKDKLEINRAKAELKEKDDNFKQYMATAREMSLRANDLYKDSLQKKTN